MAYSITYIKTPHTEDKKGKVFTVRLDRIGFKKCEYYSHFIDIDPTQEYIFAIDQSLTSTGIAIASVDFSFVAIFTVAIGTKDPFVKQKYVDTILEFIRDMLDGKKLRFVTLEAVPPSKYSRVRHQLDPLKGAVEAGLNKIQAVQELQEDYKFTIYPNTWKSTVYDKKEKRTGAFNNKSEIAKDIVKLYPDLDGYYAELQRTVGHDFDGFDAFGLLVHTRIKCFTPGWDLINTNAKYQLGKFHVLYAYLTDKEAIDDGILCKALLPWATIGMLDTRVWNINNSIFYNLLMAANTNKVICMECKSVKQVLSFLIEFNVDYDKERVLYIIVAKEGSKLLSSTIIKSLEKNNFYHKVFYKEA